MMIQKVKIFIAITCMFFLNGVYAQDLTLWYNKPASKWVEALPIGNGRLGAMIFGGVKQDRIQFNEETLWTGYPREYNKKGAYQYLDSIRNLLFSGKQKEAEALAGREFMGLKSDEGGRQEWVKRVTSILTLKDNPSLQNYNDKSWATMQAPVYDGWEAVGHEGLDGAVWLRKNFVLPQAWAGKDLKFDVNKIADHDFTYVNGKLIGTQNNADARDYTIPASALKNGENTIAILVLNYEKKGGILGYKDASRPISIYPVGDEASKISLNGQWKYFVQDDAPPSIGQYQAAYQPFGDLVLNFNEDLSKVTNYRRSLDLSNAVAATTYTLHGINFKREYIASEPGQVIAVNLSANKTGSINFEAVLTSPHKEFTVEKTGDDVLKLSVKVKDGTLNGAALLDVTTKGGNLTVENDKLIISNADEATLYLYANTNYIDYKTVEGNPETSALANLLKNADNSYQHIKAAHIKEYQKYFNTFSINFYNSKLSAAKKPSPAVVSELATDERLAKFATSNDPSFVALYAQYGRYLLISGSRPGTRPVNLQGIWNDLLAPPWGSKYTTNINAEMNYWPAELLNLSPMHQPLFQMIKELSVTGSKTAKEYYGAPGWVLHHNTDLWRGTAPINASNHGIWPTGGAWLTYHLWEHYLFTKSKSFLKDTAYPLLKSAAEFFNHFLIKDPSTGYFISTPSNSPEQGGLVAGPAMDHQIIRALFENTIWASEILNVDIDLRKILQEKIIKIAPDKIGRYGQLQEWMQDVDDTTNKHRHVSHLWAVYPGNEINWETTPGLMRAARQSLLYRGDEATGWSLGWKINLWARFKDGNHTYKLIQMLLSPAKGGAGSYPNLFDAHPPFQIDGNFAGAAGIGEMLIQSQNGYLDILPALPNALQNGDVKGIKARGGFEINMKWANGNLTIITVKSNAGGPLQLRYKNKIVNIKTLKNGIYTLNGQLKKS